MLTINSPFTPLHWGTDDVCIINLRKCLYPEKNKTGKKELKHNLRLARTRKKRAFLRAEGENNQKKISRDPVRKCIRVKKEDAKVYLLHGQFPKSWRSLLWSTCKYGSRNCAKKLWLLTNKLLTTKERKKLYFWWRSVKSLLRPPTAETCHAGNLFILEDFLYFLRRQNQGLFILG